MWEKSDIMGIPKAGGDTVTVYDVIKITKTRLLHIITSLFTIMLWICHLCKNNMIKTLPWRGNHQNHCDLPVFPEKTKQKNPLGIPLKEARGFTPLLFFS